MVLTEIPKHIPEDNIPGFVLLSPDAQQVLSKYYEKQALAMKDPRTIEIAGMKILAIPLELIAMTPLQREKFEELGGLMNPTPNIATAHLNQDLMMEWQESFETQEREIDGTLYRGFELWKKVFAGFSEYKNLTEEEAKAE